MLDVVPANGRLIADKACDANWFRDLLRRRRIRTCVPPTRSRRAPRYYDKVLYRQRNLVERFVNKLNTPAASLRASKSMP